MLVQRPQQLLLLLAAATAVDATTPPPLPAPPAKLAHFAWFHDVVAETSPFHSFTFGTADSPAGSGARALTMNAS